MFDDLDLLYVEVIADELELLPEINFGLLDQFLEIWLVLLLGVPVRDFIEVEQVAVKAVYQRASIRIVELVAVATLLIVLRTSLNPGSATVLSRSCLLSLLFRAANLQTLILRVVSSVSGIHFRVGARLVLLLL